MYVLGKRDGREWREWVVEVGREWDVKSGRIEFVDFFVGGGDGWGGKERSDGIINRFV